MKITSVLDSTVYFSFCGKDVAVTIEPDFKDSFVTWYGNPEYIEEQEISKEIALRTESGWISLWDLAIRAQSEIENEQEIEAAQQRSIARFGSYKDQVLSTYRTQQGAR